MWYDGTKYRIKSVQNEQKTSSISVRKYILQRSAQARESKKQKKKHIHILVHGGKEKKKYVHEEQAQEQVRNCYFVRYNGKIPV